MDKVQWSEDSFHQNPDLGLTTYKMVFENMLQFIGVLTPEGILLDANNRSLAYINKSKSEVLGRYFWETEWWSYDSALQSELRVAIDRACSEKKSINLQVAHQDFEGRIERFDFSISPILNAQNEVVLLIPEGRNITELMDAKEAQEASELQYKDLFEKSEDACCVIENNVFTDCNQAALNMLGYTSRKELFKVHPSELSPPLQPDGSSSFEKANNHMETAYREGSARFEWVHKRKDGTLFPVEVLLTPVRSGKKTILFTVWRDISKQKEDDERINQLNANLELQVRERTEDLEKTIQDLKMTQRELLASQKLASLGEMVAGMSHEISTPVGIGVTTASYIEMELQSLLRHVGQEFVSKHECVEAITDLLDTSATLVRNLLRASDLINSFKRVALNQANDNLVTFDLEEQLKDIIMNMSSLIKKTGHTIDLEIPQRLKIRSYPGSFSHIMTNFLMNSFQHGFRTGESGIIKVTVEQKEGGIHIQYYDNGIGVSPENIDKLFDPFFTTKRAGGNTGLGLNIVYHQVTQVLKGSITVDSTLGAGVTFNLFLPWLNE